MTGQSPQWDVVLMMMMMMMMEEEEKEEEWNTNSNQSSLNLCRGQPPIGVMIPEAV